VSESFAVREAPAGYQVAQETQRVRPGYKQTEVGVIPEDWEQTTIGDVALKVGSGITPKGGSNTYKEYGRPFVRSQNVGWGRLILGDIAYIDDEIHSTFSATELKENDVLLNITGASIGRSALADQNLIGGNVNQHVCIIRSNSNHANPKFINYLLLSSLGQRQIDSFQAGGNREGLNFGQIRSIKFPLPPTKAEQEAIAEALSDADALIEALKQLITKKRQLKQGAMQKLLTGKTRLQGFSGEWVETTLLELALGKKELFDDGDWIESEHITTEGVRLIQTGNIGIGEYTETYVKKYIYESSFVSLRCKEIREGDLLICRLADPAGRACVLPNIGEPKVVTSVDVTIFRPPSTTANRVFLANLFSSNQWFRAVSDRSGGTTHKRISRGALGRLKIKIPQLSEQTAIASILSDMDTEITALETQLVKTRELKQGMMHNLLTGEIRLI